MTTLDDCIAQQKTTNVLYPPTIKPTSRKSKRQSTSTTLSVGLYNSTTSTEVYAYITGLATDNDSSLFLLQADGTTPYYPSNPSVDNTAITTNCAILLGAPGTTTNVTIPYIAGGRIWFCVGCELDFYLNPSSAGPGLVEPSVTNTSDPNYDFSWDFCEFTYDSSQLYINISYVDFVCLPIALTVTSTTGTSQHVSGIPSDGLDTICSNLIAQNATDSAGWDQLVITSNGSNLRALSPTSGIAFDSTLFEDYWTSYVASVWLKYVSTPLVVDTQTSWGSYSGLTSNDRTLLTFSNCGSFTKPAAIDIFSASTGAFAPQTTNTDQLLNVGARLDAALNRSTLLIDANQPTDEVVSTYYTNSITNHYARIVHAANLDNKGYCFPYDDVTPTGGVDQSGFLSDASPASLLVTIGGGNAYARRDLKTQEVEQEVKQRPGFVRRDTSWMGDVKASVEEDVKSLVVADEHVDLEKGMHPKLLAEYSPPDAHQSKLPAVVEKMLGPYITKFQATPLYLQRIAPFLALLSQFLTTTFALSLRTIASRIFIVGLCLLFYLLGLFPRSSSGETQKRVLETIVGGNFNETALLPHGY